MAMQIFMIEYITDGVNTSMAGAIEVYPCKDFLRMHIFNDMDAFYQV
jgi:hypothetical protein